MAQPCRKITNHTIDTSKAQPLMSDFSGNDWINKCFLANKEPVIPQSVSFHGEGRLPHPGSCSIYTNIVDP